jgi:transposase
MTVSALSKKYGVSPPVVANVYRGNTWKHVGGPLQIDPRSTDQNRKLVAEEELGVVREYQSGATRKAIRGKFNISAGTIINILKRHGVASHSCGHPPGLRADAVLQVRKMYSQQRISMAALAEQFGVSIAAIHRAIRGAYAPAHGIV